MNLAEGGLKRTVARLHDSRTVASGWKEVGQLKKLTRGIVPCLIGILLMINLLLISAKPVLAKTHFFFGLNVGIPIGPYPVYGYPCTAPVYVYYPPAPVYRVYPPCARGWVPGYYDPYGNWIAGYYRVDCAPYGY